LGRIISLEEHLARLNRIGIALSSERDLDKLLATILQEARRFTRAEGDMLYGVNRQGTWSGACKSLTRSAGGTSIPIRSAPSCVD